MELNLLKAINEAIDIKLRRFKDQLKYDVTLIGKIKSVDDGGLYTVTINDNDTQCKAREGLTLLVGDIVYIRCIQGNFSNKFIDSKKP
jgi:hypothetical protein